MCETECACVWVCVRVREGAGHRGRLSIGQPTFDLPYCPERWELLVGMF